MKLRVEIEIGNDATLLARDVADMLDKLRSSINQYDLTEDIRTKKIYDYNGHIVGVAYIDKENNV